MGSWAGLDWCEIDGAAAMWMTDEENAATWVEGTATETPAHDWWLYRDEDES
jgi:hypothetical protein